MKICNSQSFGCSSYYNAFHNFKKLHTSLVWNKKLEYPVIWQWYFTITKGCLVLGIGQQF